ncbi:DUF2336 domain-containing protein [Kordiimonas aquimaris]|uniref:DUF2336 domain-containing protein n=1 Tax=Kordiimonas aquimaris TaxID=707591 RepID=UPI0021D2D321|nr:DUF2336 domain-containing protein [Kordiimonas aquimaris]
MLNKLKNIFGGQKELPLTLTVEQEQTILREGTEQQRIQLAERRDARPEVLYYLAEDESVSVRRNIAKNTSTPIQADEILKSDSDEEVRAELARKIGRLVPGLKEEEQKSLRDKSIAVLEDLASDQLPKIRAMVSQEIKDAENVPKQLITRLARDIEDVVCGPILQYSPLLNDDDLREIIAAGISSKALESIANRVVVSEEVSQEIATTLDVPAVSALLTNRNAQIREDTLDQIISQAATVEDLHRPLALRPQLSVRAMKRIAGFVASALVHAMMEQSELSEDQAEELLDKVRERLASEKPGDDDEEKYAQTALDYYERSMLDDKFVLEQISQNRRELLIQCLAVMADMTVDAVRQVIHSKSGRAVTALCWKAGLTMRTAYEMQTRFALVPTAQLLHAKHGTKYPIKDDELEWHLSYFLDQS